MAKTASQAQGLAGGWGVGRCAAFRVMLKVCRSLPLTAAFLRRRPTRSRGQVQIADLTEVEVKSVQELLATYASGVARCPAH